MVSVGMAQVVDADSGEADEVFTSHAGWGRVPINEARIRKLVNECAWS